jgi:hypothetical protein
VVDGPSTTIDRSGCAIDHVDVAVHAVPSDVLEDDLKVTVVVREDSTLSEKELFRWSKTGRRGRGCGTGPS